MEVKIKDRKKEVETLRMMCNMAQLGINYEQADLITRLQSKLNESSTITDCMDVFCEWKEHWENYYSKEKK